MPLGHRTLRGEKKNENNLAIRKNRKRVSGRQKLVIGVEFNFLKMIHAKKVRLSV